jgi:gamma-glutamylcyclotransferase
MSRLTADALARVGEDDYDEEDANAVDGYDGSSVDSAAEAGPPARDQVQLVPVDTGDVSDEDDCDEMASSVASEDERMARVYDSSKLDEKVFKLACKLNSARTPISTSAHTTAKFESVEQAARPPSAVPLGHVWYFSYGSNMNVAQLLTRLGPFEEKRLMALDNYSLAFNKKVSLKKSGHGNSSSEQLGFANVVPKQGDTVYGISYLLKPHQLDLMDVFEGVNNGHYYRSTVPCRDVHNGNATVACEVYIATPQAVGEDLLPTAAYMSHLLAGRSLLPPDYLRRLEQQPVAQENKSRSFF